MLAAHPEGGLWRDRVVLVTGGNSGIGRAFVERLAAGGAKVIVCGRNEITLQELQNHNPGIVVFRCDITVRQDVLALAKSIQDRYGKLDVLINNAGIMEQVDLLDESISDDRIAYEIAVNLTGAIILTRRLLPLLRTGRDPVTPTAHPTIKVRIFRNRGHTRRAEWTITRILEVTPPSRS